MVLLLSIGAMAQDTKISDFMQPVERTESNPQIHKRDIQSRLPNQNIINHALRTPYVKPECKVYDFAGILSASDVQSIRSRVLSLVDKSQLDAAVLIFSDNTWTDSDNETLCMDFYDYNDFGVGDTHDGVCMVINMATHRFAIFDTGKPKSHNICGSHLSQYISIIQPYFRSSDYAGGINAFLDKFENDFISAEEYAQLPYYKTTEFMVLMGIAVIISLIITSVKAMRTCKIEKAQMATNYERPNSFNLTVDRTTFVSTHTTKVYIPPSNSSSSSGSSGTSHSGGSGGW